MNLLGICYSYIKEYVKAAEIFEKVIAAENNSIKALRYLGLLNSDETAGKAIDNKKRNSKDEVHNEKVKKSLSILDDFVNLKRNWKVDLKKYLIGFLLCGIVVVLILFIRYKPNNENPGLPLSQITSQTSTEETSSDEAENIKAAQELNKAQDDLKKAVAQIDYYKNSLKLYEIESLKNDKKYEAAAEMLIILKTVNFEQPEKDKFDSLYNYIMPKVTMTLKNDAWTLLKSKKYQEALDKLTKIQLYGNDWSFMDFTYYCMGRCYIGLNDAKAAVEAFTTIVNTYPKSRYNSYAVSKIKELTRIQ